MVTFMTELFNSREILETMTDFISDNEDCYSDVRAEIAGCRIHIGLKAVRKHQQRPAVSSPLTDMVDSLSKEDRNEVIDADFTILYSIEKVRHPSLVLHHSMPYYASHAWLFLHRAPNRTPSPREQLLRILLYTCVVLQITMNLLRLQILLYFFRFF